MCGIAGIVSLRGELPTVSQIEAMCDSMAYRGPDDAGYLFDGRTALGMRRLAIIDIEGGRQPVFNEDGSVAVIFNGEIYNFRELRRWLESRGHSFTTASDTEVIAHLWEEVGIDFPRHLNGMFAIAVYDRHKRRIALARDHVGIKPLYYSLTDDHLIFGSEVKVLLASGRISPHLDFDAMGQFLAWEYVPGEATLMREVRRLGPAQTLEFDLDAGRAVLREYWCPMRDSRPSCSATEAEWEDEVDATIRQAVQRQMVSDVPLGAFLSGGVDSSLVVAAMGKAETFSIGYDDPSYDETAWARRVARHLGLTHREEIITPDVLGMFDHLMTFLDDPIGDFSIFSTFLVSRLAARHVKVALSGDGGDELFGGYDTYIAQERMRSWMRIPMALRRGILHPAISALPPRASKKGIVNKAKRFVEGAAHDPELGHTRWRMSLDDLSLRRILTPESARTVVTPIGAHVTELRQRARERNAKDQALYVDFRSYLVDNCLVKVDRMTMACSLEARVPLLDREVVELAFRMPSFLKYNGCHTKILLKRVAARHVPRDCVYRQKQGFSIPIKNWLKTSLRDLVEQYLQPRRLEEGGVFEPAVVRELWRQHCDNRVNNSHLIWSLLVLEQWRDRWRVST